MKTQCICPPLVLRYINEKKKLYNFYQILTTTNRFDIKEINNLGLQEIIFSKKRDHLEDYLSYNSNYIFKDTINFADLKLYDIKITEIDSTPIKINTGNGNMIVFYNTIIFFYLE